MAVKRNRDGSYTANGRRYQSRTAAVAASRRARRPKTANSKRRAKKRRSRR